jgi:hypothetical protein
MPLKSKSGCFELVQWEGFSGKARVGIVHVTCNSSRSPMVLTNGSRCPCSTRLPKDMIEKRNKINRVFKKYEIPQT